MHDSKFVANRFLELAEANHKALTPMQVLKLVYIAHGWMLGLYGRPLIRDEVQAWQYGPVIPALYEAIKHYRSDPVEAPLRSRREEFDEQELDLLDQVYRMYGRKSGPALSRLTHNAGSPWDETYVPGSFGLRISNDLIEDHYHQLAETARSET